MEQYTFEMFKKELDDGFQIYFTYLNNRYLIYKTTENCYTQERITLDEKNPQPKLSMLTLRRVKEIFPFMTELEYKV